jgi:hypothetical protein
MACSDSTKTKSTLFISGDYFKSELKAETGHRVYKSTHRRFINNLYYTGHFFVGGGGLLATGQMKLLLQYD